VGRPFCNSPTLLYFQTSLVILSVAKELKPKAEKTTNPFLMWGHAPDPSLRSGGQG